MCLCYSVCVGLGLVSWGPILEIYGTLWKSPSGLRDVCLELREQRVHEWLCEAVGSIRLRRNMCEVNCTSQNMISDMFVLNLYVLRSTVVTRIIAQCNSTSVVAIHLSGLIDYTWQIDKS